MKKVEVEAQFKKMCRLYKSGDFSRDIPYYRIEDPLYYCAWMCEKAMVESIESGSKSFDSIEDCNDYFRKGIESQLKEYAFLVLEQESIVEKYWELKLPPKKRRTLNPFSRVGDKFIKTVRKTNFNTTTDYQFLMGALDLVAINEGYVLDFFKTRTYEYDTVPYVRREEDERLGVELLGFISHTEKALFQELRIPFTEMGIWQGYLMHILPNITPKVGHASYHATTEIYSDSDLDFVMRHIKYPPPFPGQTDLLVSLSNYLGSEVILPKITIESEGRAIVESTFWSEFGGLIRETTTAIKKGETIEYKGKDQKILLKYDCGVNF